MAKKVKLSDLIPDNKNFNKGTDLGNSLIKKSLEHFGAGRSILIDKHNNIIAGNKSVENAIAIGMDDLQIVESDGSKIIAVKRTDIDLNTPEGRELALADNATAKENILFDAELIEAEIGEAKLQEWTGLTNNQSDYQPNLNPIFGTKGITADDIKDKDNQLSNKYQEQNPSQVSVVCPHCAESFFINKDELK